MYYRNHGGYCCGIRQIFGFSLRPDEIIHARDVVVAAHNLKLDLPFAPYIRDEKNAKYPQKEPQETTLEKLDRYLRYDDALFGSGVLEIVLAESTYAHLNQVRWMPIVEERGFELVTSNLNSNSGNLIHIYHRRRVSGEVLGLARLAKTTAKTKAKPIEVKEK